MTPAEIKELRQGFEAWYPSAHPKAINPLSRHPRTRKYKTEVQIAFEAYCFAKSEPVEITEGMKARAEKALRWKCAEIEHRPSVADADAMWFADEYVDAILTAALSPAQDGEL